VKVIDISDIRQRHVMTLVIRWPPASTSMRATSSSIWSITACTVAALRQVDAGLLQLLHRVVVAAALQQRQVALGGRLARRGVAGGHVLEQLADDAKQVAYW
jgi:hypothetical protein